MIYWSSFAELMKNFCEEKGGISSSTTRLEGKGKKRLPTHHKFFWEHRFRKPSNVLFTCCSPWCATGHTRHGTDKSGNCSLIYCNPHGHMGALVAIWHSGSNFIPLCTLSRLFFFSLLLRTIIVKWEEKKNGLKKCAFGGMLPRPIRPKRGSQSRGQKSPQRQKTPRAHAFDSSRNRGSRSWGKKIKKGWKRHWPLD